MLYGPIFYFFGPKTLLALLPSLYVAGLVAMVIFVVEHQFEDADWLDSREWNFYEASVTSSSYLSMPKILEWFTGNIGYHHIHHLNPRVPSYRLRECFLRVRGWIPSKEVRLKDISRNLLLALWSKEEGRLVTFKEAAVLAS